MPPIRRRMKTITDDGVVTGTNRRSKRAKVVWRHWQAAWRMRDTGAEFAMPVWGVAPMRATTTTVAATSN